MYSACWCRWLGLDIDGNVVHETNLYHSLVELSNVIVFCIWFHSVRCCFVIRILPRCQLNMNSGFADSFCIPGSNLVPAALAISATVVRWRWWLHSWNKRWSVDSSLKLVYVGTSPM